MTVTLLKTRENWLIIVYITSSSHDIKRRWLCFIFLQLTCISFGRLLTAQLHLYDLTPYVIPDEWIKSPQTKLSRSSTHSRTFLPTLFPTKFQCVKSHKLQWLKCLPPELFLFLPYAMTFSYVQHIIWRASKELPNLNMQNSMRMASNSSS